MAKDPSNAELKRRNGKIFRTIESKLESNDEETFLNAASKIKSYVEKREAYYPEARPLIVNICKTARATLTRLTKLHVPFSADRPFPPELKNRVIAYALLIGTVLRYVNTFETDHLLREDLRELFNSVMLNAPQSPESTAESTANPRPNGLGEKTPTRMDDARSESKDPLYTELHQETHNNTKDAEMLEMGDSTSKSETVEGKHPATPPLTCQLANDIDSAHPTAHSPARPPPSFVNAGQAVNSQTALSVEISPLHSPTAPTLPHGTLKGTVGETMPSEKKAGTNPARKARKIPKLVGKAQTDIVLEDMDWQYHMLKQQQTPSGSVVATAKDQSASAPISSNVVDQVSIIDGKVKEAMKAAPATVSSLGTSRGDPSRAGSTSAPNDADPTIDIDLDLPREDLGEGRTLAGGRRPTSEGGSMDISSDQVPLAQIDSKHSADTPATDSHSALTESAGINTSVVDTQNPIRSDSLGADLVRLDENRGLVSPGHVNGPVEHVDAMDIDDPETGETGHPVEGSNDQSSGLHHHTLRYMNTQSPRSSVPRTPQIALANVLSSHSIIFGAIDVGGKAGDTRVIDFELAPDQKNKLTDWQTRDRHEREVSGSICLSLVCYKISDVLAAGFNLDSKDSQILPLALAGLTPSWPTNARLSAEIGPSKLFLAPPFQLTMEGLVDISLYVNEGCVKIRFDHAEDMTEYIFVLVAHPPTPSQLLELEERKAKNRKFRATLEGLRLTAVEVFS